MLLLHRRPWLRRGEIVIIIASQPPRLLPPSAQVAADPSCPRDRRGDTGGEDEAGVYNVMTLSYAFLMFHRTGGVKAGVVWFEAVFVFSTVEIVCVVESEITQADKQTGPENTSHTTLY